MDYAVKIEHLGFAYGDGHVALRDVSLAVQPGEKVALVGPNGAGKSTLMLHMNGILQPGSGSVTVSGLLVDDKTLGKVRARVGLVFQDPDDQLFSPTVFDDVAFGPIYQGFSEKEVRARVDRALAAVQMCDYISRVSHHLSVGEKKRIAIATVLSMDPEILVLDEPTAGLDPRAARPDHAPAHPAADDADLVPRPADGRRAAAAHGGDGSRRGRRRSPDGRGPGRYRLVGSARAGAVGVASMALRK